MFRAQILRDPNPGDGGGAPTLEQLEQAATAAGEQFIATPTPEAKTKLADALSAYKTAVAASAGVGAGGEIKPEAYKGLQADLFKAKETARKLAEEKAQLDARLKVEEQKKLAEEGRFKELWEKEQKEKADAKAQSDSVVRAYVRDKKIGVLQEEAIKAGMRPETLSDLQVIDTTLVTTEVITGPDGLTVNVNGAAEFIQALKQTRPWNFATGKNPNINDDRTPAGGFKPGSVPKPGTVTGDALLKLEKENPALFKAYIGQWLKGVPVA